MNSESTPELDSPCVGICLLDDTTGLCVGCLRNGEEIAYWWKLDTPARQRVLDAVAERRLARAG